MFLKTVRFLRTWITTDAPWIALAVRNSILYAAVAVRQQRQWDRVGPKLSARYDNRFLFRLTRPDDAGWMAAASIFSGVSPISQQAQWIRTYPRVNPVYNRYYAKTVFDNAWIFSAVTPPPPGAAAVERTRSIFRGVRRGELTGIG